MRLEDFFGYTFIILFLLGIVVLVYKIRTKSAYFFLSFFVITFICKYFDTFDLSSKIANLLEPNPHPYVTGQANNVSHAFVIIDLTRQIDQIIFGTLITATMISFVLMAFSIPRPQEKNINAQ